VGRQLLSRTTQTDHITQATDILRLPPEQRTDMFHTQWPCDVRTAQQARVGQHDEHYIGCALSNVRVAVNMY
jgi:hypothetical protein